MCAKECQDIIRNLNNALIRPEDENIMHVQGMLESNVISPEPFTQIPNFDDFISKSEVEILSSKLPLLAVKLQETLAVSATQKDLIIQETIAVCLFNYLSIIFLFQWNIFRRF